MAEPPSIPLVDLFAGPGGLGEGFSAFVAPGRFSEFKIALSIEMEYWAHQTLELRSFFHYFRRSRVPAEYYGHIRGEITRQELFERFPHAADTAARQAWRVELGATDPSEVDRRIRTALNASDRWVLCGGPPCQAFSIVGRSRNGGISDQDHRVYLYRQYLRILSMHEPPVFIMENVKGLLSSQVKGSEIFQQMLDDLRYPAGVEKNPGGTGARYSLYSLVARDESEKDQPYEPSDFVVKCENYGIPQSRHRVIVLGVRDDLAHNITPTLQTASSCIAARSVLRGLPSLRSGLTRQHDAMAEWQAAVDEIRSSEFMRSRRGGNDQLVRQRVFNMLDSMRTFQADRGAEFMTFRPQTEYQPDWFLDPSIGGVCNHTSRPHMKSDLHRYLFVASYAKVYGRSPELKDFPPELHPDHKNLDAALTKGHFDDRFRVQVSDRPATTITSHIAKDGHYFIHYDETQCRSLTVREAARLQTFPDNYYFCGPRTHQYRQVGNAVPPLLARQIASLVSQILSGADCQTGEVPAAAYSRRAAING